MLIFSVYVDDVDEDGYTLEIEVSEGVPSDIVKKIAKEVAESVSQAVFPEQE